jgi:two-component system NtrC family sensor kinase
MDHRDAAAAGHEAYYRSLARKMVLIFILVSFTPMVMITGLILYNFRVSSREKVHAHLEELVEKHKQNIDSFLAEKLANIRLLAGSYTFDQLNDEIFLQERLKSLQKEFGPVFEDLGVITQDGLQSNYAGPFKLVKALYSEAEWFKKAVQSEFYISDVFLGLRGLPHFIVAVRKDWHGSPWILRATIDFVAFNSLVENLRVGKTGFAYIVNKEGEFQTKPRFDVMPDRTAHKYFDGKEKPGMKTVHILKRTDAEGGRYIYAASFLKNGDWLMIFQQSFKDAYSDLKRTQWIALAALCVGGIAIFFTALLLAKRMVNKIAAADREKEMMNQQVIETGKLASVGELAAGIAHEINNPVAIMVEEAGWVQDLLEEEEFSQSENLNEFKRALDQIKNQGRRCKEITHKLLSFARRTDSRIQDLQINELIEELVHLSGQRAKYAGVTIETHLDKDLPRVQASQTEMQQVLLNLINNSLDALEPKGGTIDVKSRLNGSFIEIEVADNGPGIPRQNLERIFDPFFTTKPVGKGTGLGLSICYGIVKKMGGEIDVKSMVGTGTAFWVRIPYKEVSGVGVQVSDTAPS